MRTVALVVAYIVGGIVVFNVICGVWVITAYHLKWLRRRRQRGPKYIVVAVRPHVTGNADGRTPESGERPSN